MNKFIHSASLTLLTLSSIILVGLQIKLFGWILLVIGFSILLLSSDKQFRKDISLLFISLFFLGIAHISTDISFPNSMQMAIPAILAVVVPYWISRYIYKDYAVRFKFHHGRSWYKTEIFYVVGTALICYLVWPFIFRATGSYHNWTVQPDANYLILFFLAMNLTGIWDEFFFMSTVLGILKRHLPFLAANLIQCVIFTSFLYDLGFRGWSFLAIFLFAFLQGRVYQKTNSLFYLISIHLAADFILYLALIHAYYPNLLPIFLIK